MPKAYIVVAQNRLFSNNSGKLDLIGTKFYRGTSAQVACSPANL